MADQGTSAIDRFFDAIDDGIEAADRVMNRSQLTEDRARRVRRANVDTAPSVKVKGDQTPSNATAVAVRRFRIIEAIAAETGTMIFVVTNGTQRAECSTREMAEKILSMMETAP